MTSTTPFHVLLLSLMVYGHAHAFWFSSARAKSQPPQWFGIRDYGAAGQTAYSFDSNGGVTVAVPVAVPISPNQLQMSPPYSGLNAVQLVPCLCPISKDPEGGKPGQHPGQHPAQHSPAGQPVSFQPHPGQPVGQPVHMQPVHMQHMQPVSFQTHPGQQQPQASQAAAHSPHPPQ